MASIIATFFYVGYLRPAPGTWGSVVALPLAYIIHIYGGFIALASMTLFIAMIGWWAIATATKGKSKKDYPEFIIDEVTGQWLALWSLSWAATFYSIDILSLWPSWIIAFLMFRIFDIFKPGPIGWADKRRDALGVMLDDILAGVAAGVATTVFTILYYILT
ncbi:MAG: phosphatidylglycerophosphatase A [Aestuariivita sp.]|nr:phosphatidylglycerophosphatase A [Aestuariivita sp.]